MVGQELLTGETVSSCLVDGQQLIQTAWVGAPAIVEGIPVRYAHATNCISACSDYEAGVEMLIALLENITEDVIRSF